MANTISQAGIKLYGQVNQIIKENSIIVPALIAEDFFDKELHLSLSERLCKNLRDVIKLC